MHDFRVKGFEPCCHFEAQLVTIVPCHVCACVCVVVRFQVVLSTLVNFQLISTTSLGSVFDNLVMAARSPTQALSVKTNSGSDLHREDAAVRVRTVAVVVVSVMNFVVGLMAHFNSAPRGDTNSTTSTCLLPLFEALCALRSMLTQCEASTNGQEARSVKPEPASLVVALTAHIATVVRRGSTCGNDGDDAPLLQEESRRNHHCGGESAPMFQPLKFFAHLD